MLFRVGFWGIRRLHPHNSGLFARCDVYHPSVALASYEHATFNSRLLSQAAADGRKSKDGDKTQAEQHEQDRLHFPEHMRMTKELAEKLDVMKRLFNDAPLVKEYNQLMDDLERRRVNTRRVRLGLLLAAGCVLFAFYDFVQRWFTKQATEITTKSLEDPEFQQSAAKFCEDIVQQLTHSERIQTEVEYLVNKVVIHLQSNEQFQKELEALIIPVITSYSTRTGASHLTGSVVRQIMCSEEYASLRKSAIEFLIKEANKIAREEEMQRAIGILARNSARKAIGL